MITPMPPLVCPNCRSRRWLMDDIKVRDLDYTAEYRCQCGVKIRRIKMLGKLADEVLHREVRC